MPAELPQLTSATTAVVGAVGTAAGGVGAWLLRWRSARREDVSALTQALETLAERNSALIAEADARWHEQREREYQRLEQERQRWEQERQERREHLDELERLRGVVRKLEERIDELERRLARAHGDIVSLVDQLQAHGVERPAGLSPEAPGNGKKEADRCDTP